MTRWIPHIHYGRSSGECLSDDEAGREGFYLDICWLGWMLGFTLASLRWERRHMAEIRARYARPGQ